MERPRALVAPRRRDLWRGRRCGLRAGAGGGRGGDRLDDLERRRRGRRIQRGPRRRGAGRSFTAAGNRRPSDRTVGGRGSPGSPVEHRGGRRRRAWRTLLRRQRRWQWRKRQRRQPGDVPGEFRQCVCDRDGGAGAVGGAGGTARASASAYGSEATSTAYCGRPCRADATATAQHAGTAKAVARLHGGAAAAIAVSSGWAGCAQAEFDGEQQRRRQDPGAALFPFRCRRGGWPAASSAGDEPPFDGGPGEPAILANAVSGLDDRKTASTLDVIGGSGSDGYSGAGGGRGRADPPWASTMERHRLSMRPRPPPAAPAAIPTTAAGAPGGSATASTTLSGVGGADGSSVALGGSARFGVGLWPRRRGWAGRRPIGAVKALKNVTATSMATGGAGRERKLLRVRHSRGRRRPRRQRGDVLGEFRHARATAIGGAGPGGDGSAGGTATASASASGSQASSVANAIAGRRAVWIRPAATMARAARRMPRAR